MIIKGQIEAIQCVLFEVEAISASYELIEFGVALATGEATQAFLGTQGDVWDTQWDMLLALVRAITALIILGRYHDHFLARHQVRD
nr:DUF2238 domain-containing protein [Sporomusa silvacetica]